MFPVTEDYIEREYTIDGNHMVLTSKHSVKEIERKAKKIMALIKRGVKFMPTQPDTNAIMRKLRENLETTTQEICRIKKGNENE